MAADGMIHTMAGGKTRRTLDELLDSAHARIRRYEPAEALEAIESGALLIDIRSDLDRERDGIVPGSLHIPRTVLEWRLEPDSDWRNPHVGGLDRQIILICDHGCSSVLAAATLVDLGFTRAGDVIGGFAAWSQAALPRVPCSPRRRGPAEPAGMGAPASPSGSDLDPQPRRDQAGIDRFVIEVDDPRRGDVRALLEQHLAFAKQVTPPEDVHALDLDGLLDRAVTLFSLRVEGRLLGVGAIKQLESDHAELKSMHTAIAARRRGVGRAIVDHLVAVAAARGVRRVSLETGAGEAFAPARALYAAAGFASCEPFGDYEASPNSAFMTRRLA